MTQVGSITNVQQPLDISGMDIETALLAVQSSRANLLEDQLKGQMEAVQKKNEKIAQLNQLMGALTGAQSSFKGEIKNEHKLGDQDAYKKDGYKQEKEINDALKGAGFDPGPFGDKAYPTNMKDANGETIMLKGGIHGDITKGDLDKAIANIKGQIDALSNSQQMDMLRLQSLSNKRNEAFDIMSNFIKKMQDSRSSIVGNMR
jgi:prefoldin subunit 5